MNRWILCWLVVMGSCFMNLQPVCAQTNRNKNSVDAPQDSIPLYILDTVSIEARQLKNYNYTRYAGIVRIVYPYADTAIMMFKVVQDTSGNLSKKEYRAYKKETEDWLRTRFTDKLKDMNRVEGKVLIDIIERNTGKTMFDILKEVKSGSSAFWWNNLGKLYGYDLREPYDPTADPSLEIIIQDYEKAHGKRDDRFEIKDKR